MAFSFRKMFSNISYFKRPDEANDSDLKDNGSNKRRYPSLNEHDRPLNTSYEKTDLDLSSRKFASTGKKFDGPIRHFTAKKVSISNPDLSNYDVIRKPKKLKLDIEKANKSMDEISEYANCFIENTPEQISLGLRSDMFSARFKELDFNKSFDLFDYMSEGERSTTDKHPDSDTDVSDFFPEVKMCRKVDNNLSDDSFVVLDANEDDRLSLLSSYQKKLDKIDKTLKDLLIDFEFDIEVTNVFFPDRFTSLPGVEFTKLKSYGTSTRDTPDTSWDAIANDKKFTKNNMKKQLMSMQTSIQDFIKLFLNDKLNFTKERDRKLRINRKKRDRSIQDVPDLQDVFHSMFNEDFEDTSIYEEKCTCLCHDSGITTKTPKSDTNQTVTSSLGNFSLDISTLSLYSDTLDNLSYNSFNDSSFYNAVLQKSALDRITFYIQVHGIRFRSDLTDFEFESKNQITFYCKACDFTETNERGLLKHILSISHAEKIHFLYKTAYIRICIVNNVEIQPSTVLNPMLMYRDFNKIVCLGDGKYACSLCFENFIIGESVLMAHCNETCHIERRNAMHEIFE